MRKSVSIFTPSMTAQKKTNPTNEDRNLKNESNKKRRVSFHPGTTENNKQTSNSEKETSHKTPFSEEKLFETQNYIESSLIIESEKRKVNGRMSLDPMGKIEIAEEKAPEKVTTEISKESLLVKEKPKRNNHVDEFMYANEIRFLDKIISKISLTNVTPSGGKADPAKKHWIKNSLKPRVEFFKTMIKFLQQQMTIYQDKIEIKQKSLDLTKIKTNNLKNIRNESRNKTKLEWYQFRRAQETNFNKLIVDNEQQLQVTKATKTADVEKLREECLKLAQDKVALQEKVTQMNSEINENENLNTDDFEDLKYRLMQQVTRTEILKQDEEDLKKKLFERDVEVRIIKDRIKDLQNEIDKLDFTIMGKNAGDKQLMDLQRKNKLYEDVFKIKIIQATATKVIMFIGGFKFEFNILPDTTVTKFVAHKKEESHGITSHIYDNFFLENMLDELNNQREFATENKVPENATNDHIINGVSKDDMEIVEKAMNYERKKRFSVSAIETAQKDEFLNTMNLENTLDIFMREKLFANEETQQPSTVTVANKKLKLKEVLCKILHKMHVVAALVKEIGILNEWCKIDSFYVKNKIYLRFYLQSFDSNMGTLDLCIDRLLNLMHENKVVSDLKKQEDGLSKYVTEYITK